jgi:hypothetical protein
MPCTTVRNAELDELGRPIMDENGDAVMGPPTWAYISAAPRSTHGQGVNVANLDGSVSFEADDIDEIVFAYRAAIDDEAVHDGL